MLYKRILLKLSGEALVGSQPYGIQQESCLHYAKAIKTLAQSGVQVAVVIGGGNIFRGMAGAATGMQRTPADQMGMLATLINGLALREALEGIHCPVQMMTALDCPKVAESYNWRKALDYLAAGEVVLFTGGTGHPYFSTDTSAALRAAEIHADALFKATKVDGVYNKDPLKYPDAVMYQEITYSQILAEKLLVIDATAITLCRNSNIPILVFNMNRIAEEKIFTLVTHKIRNPD